MGLTSAARREPTARAVGDALIFRPMDEGLKVRPRINQDALVKHESVHNLVVLHLEHAVVEDLGVWHGHRCILA